MARIYVHVNEPTLPSSVSLQDVAPGVTVAFDHHGAVVGIEILGAHLISIRDGDED